MSSRVEFIESAQFVQQREQLQELDTGGWPPIQTGLLAARRGAPMWGIENPWGPGSPYMRWPRGEYWIVLRELPPEDVAEQLGGDPRTGFSLVRLVRLDGSGAFP